MFKVGKNITVNADQVLEFRGLNDAGEEIKIGQITKSVGIFQHILKKPSPPVLDSVTPTLNGVPKL